MYSYRYRVYYSYMGPSHSDPFARRKSPEEVAQALREFPRELGHRLLDREAHIFTTEAKSGTNEVVLSVETTASEKQFTSALTVTLREWKLLAEARRPSTGVA